MNVITNHDSELVLWSTDEARQIAGVRGLVSEALAAVGPERPEAVELRRAARALALVEPGVRLGGSEDCVADDLAGSHGTVTADVADLRALIDVTQAKADVVGAEARLRAAVSRARARGLSWDRIGPALGVSKQAARTRFGIR